MLGSRLAAQLWQTSVYTNKACRAVGAPVCFWCRGASAFICISAQACAACACARNVNVIVAGRRVPWRAGEQLCFRGLTLRCSHVRRMDKGRLAEHRTATGDVVSREDGPRPSLLMQGQTGRCEPWVPLKQMLQPRPAPVSFTPQIPQSSAAAQSQSLIKFK